MGYIPAWKVREKLDGLLCSREEALRIAGSEIALELSGMGRCRQCGRWITSLAWHNSCRTCGFVNVVASNEPDREKWPVDEEGVA